MSRASLQALLMHCLLTQAPPQQGGTAYSQPRCVPNMYKLLVRLPLSMSIESTQLRLLPWLLCARVMLCCPPIVLGCEAGVCIQNEQRRQAQWIQDEQVEIGITRSRVFTTTSGCAGPTRRLWNPSRHS